MLKDGSTTAGRVQGISNANQYLVYLTKLGLIKFEWKKKDKSRFKEWSIKDYAKASEFLKR